MVDDVVSVAVTRSVHTKRFNQQLTLNPTRTSVTYSVRSRAGHSDGSG
jgi:hypothetical protein